MNFDYDVIVIGSGSGGLTVSIGLDSAGKKVVLIEKGLIGGDCTNFGCVPSKALIDIAKSGNYSFKEAMIETRKRRKSIQDEETPEKIEKYGLKVIKGFASFKEKNTILIDGKDEITAKNIIISTGSHANIINIEGVKKEDLLTNESIFEIEEDLKDLIVVGGGYIGAELSEAFANLGINVTIIQRNNYLIPKEEVESRELLKEIFEKKGIQVLTSTNIDKAENNFLIVKNQNGNKKIKYDKILIALGREANIDGLNLENAGINYNKGIIVDKYNKTSQKNIFAIGDCVDNNPQFTHLANDEGRCVVRNILVPFLKKSVKNNVLPAVLYTNIEVARVGKTKEELLEYLGEDEFRSEIIYFKNNDKSRLTNDTIGFVKINFKRVTGKILGATIVGTKAGEMLLVIISAIQNNISAYKLSKIIFPYPTKSETIKKVCDKFVIYTISNLKNEIKFLLKEHILQIITALIWGSIIIGYLWFKSKYNLSNVDIAKKLYIFFQNPMWGPFVYIIIYAIRPIIFFPATLLTFMSGTLFGIWGGFLFTMIGENLSANFAYIIGRIFGKKLIPEGSNGILNDLKVRFSGSSFIPVLLTRFLFFPFDLVNYGAGILKADWKGFFFGTLIGIIPGALVFIIAGSSVENVGSFDFSKISFNKETIALSILIFIFSLILAKFLKKYENIKNIH